MECGVQYAQQLFIIGKRKAARRLAEVITTLGLRPEAENYNNRLLGGVSLKRCLDGGSNTFSLTN
jgi:hypothetical protein